MTTYDKRHGGPYDRGSADAWYGRPRLPHYYRSRPHSSDRVPETDMTPEEIRAYHAGYSEQTGEKDYGPIVVSSDEEESA